jgi:hypothetical protein
MSFREENLNVVLAELLAERGLNALGEVILKKRGKRTEPDVLLLLNGVRIVIEGKKFGMWGQLVSKCVERVDDNVCDLCVMVEYADIRSEKLTLTQSDIKQMLLKSRFNIGFVSYLDRATLGKPSSQPEKYENVSFDDLITYLMAAYNRVVREDIIEPVVRRMDEVLSEFASKAAPLVDLERLKEALELREKEGEDVE